MIVAQVFLEAMEGCDLLLGPLSWCKPRFPGFAHPRLCKYSAAFRVSFLRPVSTVSGRLSLWLLVLFGLSTEVPFSWLLSVARFFAASSRIARKRRSLSCPVSLARLRAASFRLVPRRFSLCSVVSRARLEALLSRIIFKRFSRSSLDSWDSLCAHNPSELGAPCPATPYQAPTPSGR